MDGWILLLHQMHSFCLFWAWAWLNHFNQFYLSSLYRLTSITSGREGSSSNRGPFLGSIPVFPLFVFDWFVTASIGFVRRVGILFLRRGERLNGHLAAYKRQPVVCLAKWKARLPWLDCGRPKATSALHSDWSCSRDRDTTIDVRLFFLFLSLAQYHESKNSFKISTLVSTICCAILSWDRKRTRSQRERERIYKSLNSGRSTPQPPSSGWIVRTGGSERSNVITIRSI